MPLVSASSTLKHNSESPRHTPCHGATQGGFQRSSQNSEYLSYHSFMELIERSLERKIFLRRNAAAAADLKVKPRGFLENPPENYE